MSAQLRRILIDREILAVAAPRIGKIHFRVPDDQDVLAQESSWRFISGHTARFRGALGFKPFFFNGHRDQGVPSGQVDFISSAEYTTPARDVRLEVFCSDRIMRVDGEYITRDDVLKFVCYHGYGVHFSGKKLPIFDAIKKVRYCVTIQDDRAVGEHVSTGMILAGIDAPRPKARNFLDIPLIHLLSTAYFLVTSTDVLALEEVIRLETEQANSWPPSP